MKKVFKILSFALASFLSAFFICVNAFASSEPSVIDSEGMYELSNMSESSFSKFATLYCDFYNFDPTNKEDKTLNKYVVITVFDKTDNKYYILSPDGLKYSFFGLYRTSYPNYTAFGTDDNLSVYCGNNISSGATNNGYILTNITNPHIEYVDFGTYKEYYLNLTFSGSIYQNGKIIKNIDTNLNFKFYNITTTSNTCPEGFLEHEFYINTRIFGNDSDAIEFSDGILSGDYSRLPEGIGLDTDKESENKELCAKFLNLGSYTSITPDKFRNWISRNSCDSYEFYNDSGDKVISYHYNGDIDKQTVAMYPYLNNGAIQTNDTKLVLQVMTPNDRRTSIYLKIDCVYSDTQKNYILGFIPWSIEYFNSYISKYCIINPSSMTSLNPNSTYVFKLDLAGFMPMNYMRSYCISIYSTNGELLDCCSYVYGGPNQSDGSNSNLIEIDVGSTDGRTDLSDKIGYNDDGILNDSTGIDYSKDLSLQGYNKNSLSIDNFIGDIKNFGNNISGFFQACYGLIPQAIMTIIIAGVALVVILRVLGR